MMDEGKLRDTIAFAFIIKLSDSVSREYTVHSYELEKFFMSVGFSVGELTNSPHYHALVSFCDFDLSRTNRKFVLEIPRLILLVLEHGKHCPPCLDLGTSLESGSKIQELRQPFKDFCDAHDFQKEVSD